MIRMKGKKSKEILSLMLTLVLLPGTLTSAVLANGGAQFTLRHGQSLTIEGVNADGSVRVIEDDYEPLYETSFTKTDRAQDGSIINTAGPVDGRDTAQLPMTENHRTLTFVNERDDVPVAGVDAGGIGAMLILPLLALLAGAAYLTAAAAYRRRRKEAQ